MLNSLEQQILAEVSGDYLLSYHWKGNHPIDPIHMKMGFLTSSLNTPFAQESGLQLSDVCSRFWIFLAAFVNLKEPADQYAASVDRIFEKLNHEETKYLIRMPIAPGTFRNVQIIDWDRTSITVEHYANIYCKAILHKYFHFAGI